MSVVSTAAALSRPFLFEEGPDVGTAALGCPVEQSSTTTHAAHSLPGVARHDSRGRLSLNGHLIPSTHNQRFPPASITPASQLAIRPAPEMASSGIPALDALTGGLPRGCLTELCGPSSSGRTTVLLAALAAATRRGEFCALIDASDALDPHSAAAAGIDLDRLLWVRCDESSPRRYPSTSLRAGSATEKTKREKDGSGCPTLAAPFAARVCPERAQRAEGVGISPQPALNVHQNQEIVSHENGMNRLEQVLRATDLLLESGGFSLIVLDLADLPPQAARRIPLTTWFRFRRAVEHRPTILLAIEQHPIAGSCSSLQLQLGITDAPAAERRQNAAHGASRGFDEEDEQGPEGRKKIHEVGKTVIDRESVHPPHAHLLTGLNINAELIRSRHERKPARSIAFETKTAWAG